MERPSESARPPATPRRERLWVLFFCLAAGLHVFIYAAALPFFNGVDEPAHFDTVMQYAHGHIPRQLEPYTADTLRAMALFDAKFYLPANQSVEPSPPPWTWPADQQAARIAAQKPAVPGANYESSQPPMYYVFGAAWWRLAAKLGLSEGSQLYGLHFLNVPVVMLVVWLGWLAARIVFPAHPFRRLAIPAFIAVLPQSAFYSIENDVLSPLYYGLAFLGLLRFLTADVPGVPLGCVTGLALAAAFLTKITNSFPILLLLLCLAAPAHRWWRQGRLKLSLPSLAALAACAALPMLAWMVWCQLHFGDLTGSRLKADFWGWTPKPLWGWWPHPLFTPYGCIKFLNHFLPQFWQGEITWHLHPLSFRLADCTYTAVTTGLLAVCLLRLTFRPASVPELQRRVLWMSFLMFASAAAFLVYISVAFDFHDCYYPSREFPYLYCGRQALAALIPFLLVFTTGLDTLLARWRDRSKFVLLGALLGLILAAEAAANRELFTDSFNWFHL